MQLNWCNHACALQKKIAESLKRSVLSSRRRMGNAACTCSDPRMDLDKHQHIRSSSSSSANSSDARDPAALGAPLPLPDRSESQGHQPGAPFTLIFITCAALDVTQNVLTEQKNLHRRESWHPNSLAFGNGRRGRVNTGKVANALTKADKLRSLLKRARLHQVAFWLFASFYIYTCICNEESSIPRS